MSVPEKCRCGNPHDAWPAADGGELCQMCWEAECSESWWDTCGGLLKSQSVADYEIEAGSQLPNGQWLPLSVPDYAEIGRELAENRDATLVNAANRGVKYHEELESAKQRIAELKAALKRSDDQASDLEDIAERAVLAAEAAERKLATAREILSESDPHVAQMEVLGRLTVAIGRIQRAFDALAEIEQPQEPKQQLPGEDPPFEKCQCSACVALREKA